MLRAGTLRHRAVIRTASESSDGRGGKTVSWVDGDTVWDVVQPMNGREYVQASAIRNAMGYAVRLRYHSSVTPKTRLLVTPGSHLLEVLEVVNDGLRDEWMRVACVEVDA